MRWAPGMSFMSEGCAEGQVFQLHGCADDGTEIILSDAECATPTFEPFGIAVSDRLRSTFGFEVNDYKPRVNRKLLACQSKLIEKELWAGGNSNSINPAFTDATGPEGPVDVSPVTKPKADAIIASIEQAIADCGCGSRSLIHMRPYILGLILAHGNNVLRREGNKWLTPMDHIVIPGSGYTGAGINGDAVTSTNEWIFATPMIEIRLGPVDYTPNTMAEAIDRKTNTVRFFAQRVAAATFDTSCCWLGLKVDKT